MRVETAKGNRWERRTIKHHVLLTMDGCMAASAVADGDRDDYPMLLKLAGTVPMGSGYRWPTASTAARPTARRPFA